MRTETILTQLGGRKFMVMTGAKHFTKDAADTTLSFQLPRNFAKDGINGVRITLTNDLYDVEFVKIGTARSGYKHTVVASSEGVYAEDLVELFERTTGLVTHF